MRFVRTAGLAAALAVFLAGCAGIRNEPVNLPITGNPAEALGIGRESSTYADDLMVGLAFSGGGTRAAAFSLGVLAEIERTRVMTRTGAMSLLDRVDFVSGVSGGSVLAAYYGLKQRQALADFRERFLLRDAEESLNTDVSPLSVVRALSGGVNDSSQFPRWLDKNLFEGATFREFRHNRRPRIWINAADIYNRTTFVFGATAFGALCSDLSSYPIADAVAASAAVPVVFAPVVIKSYKGGCGTRLPEWITRARSNPNAAPMLRSFADAIARYHDGSMNYVKLLDGGLVDNFGLTGFTIARLSSDTPYGPFTPEQAVRLRRSIFIIVDAGQAPSGDWVQTVDGPGGIELVRAAADTAVDASLKASFTAFDATMDEWQVQLVRWRCGLSSAQRQKLGVPPGWNCRDLKFFIGRVAFDQLGMERAQLLNTIPTRFKLPVEQVDLLIDSGAEALRVNSGFRQFLTSLGGRVPSFRPPPFRSNPPRVAGANGAADAFASALPEIPAAVSSNRN
jgi:NTE family protein